MIIIDSNGRFFRGSNFENITVTVRSQNTNHGVTFNLNGQTGVMPETGPQSSALTFQLDQSANVQSTLLMLFHYAGANGDGKYLVVIAGDGPGGETFREVVEQLGVSDIVSSRGYNFDVA